MALEPENLFINGPVELTATQRRVADFLLREPEEAIFATAAVLGRRIGVSDATVVRASQAFGFSGYAHLQRHLRERLKSRLDTVTRLQHTADHIKTVADILPAVLRADAANLRNTGRAVSATTFQAVVEMLQQAEVVHVIGLRSAHSLAHFTASALRLLGRRVVILTPGYGEMWSEVDHLGPGSVLVAFSFPRYTRVTIETAAAAKKSGASVIAVTDSALSPLAAQADQVLPAFFSLDSYLESFVAALSLINAVATGIAFLDGDQSLDRLRKLERSWQERDIYYRETGSGD